MLTPLKGCNECTYINGMMKEINTVIRLAIQHYIHFGNKEFR